MNTDTIRVLIADDNREFGDILREYLEAQGDIRVSGVARDGWAAYDMILALRPDIVVLDIIMPGLDGLGILEKINAEETDKPVFIVLSAVGTESTTQRALALGAEYYFVKPFNMDVLVDRIRQLHAAPPE